MLCVLTRYTTGKFSPRNDKNIEEKLLFSVKLGYNKWSIKLEYTKCYVILLTMSLLHPCVCVCVCVFDLFSIDIY